MSYFFLKMKTELLFLKLTKIYCIYIKTSTILICKHAYMVDIFEFPIVISVKIQQCIPKRQNYKILNFLHAVARENDYTLS